VQVRPLPSAEVVLSSACERYCGPLRLPGQPPATSGFALIRRGGTPVVHWTGSPVVPCDAVRACRPCYPGGFPPARQLWWLWEHRPSPNVHRVGTLSFVTRLRLGSLHATACAVARPLGGRSSGNLVLWVTPHTSLKLPGRTANSQGRTSTGKSHSIHGMRTLPLVSLSISRLQDWVGEASDRAQDRGIRPEEERAGKGSVGTEEQDGLTGKDKEAENDEAHRARVRAEADPRVPHQVHPGHLREGVRSRESRYAAPRTIPAAPA